MEDVEMKDEEPKEVAPLQPEIFEQQKQVEQPAPVFQSTRTTPAKDKRMLPLDDRMKEFRDMLLERSVSAQCMHENTGNVKLNNARAGGGGGGGGGTQL